MSMWRNRYTRTFEGRVEKSLRVQVPPSTIKKGITLVIPFLICLIGEGFNQFLRVQRERAEAGVLLFGVMKSRKQNTELPLNASDQNKSPHRHHKKRDKNLSFLFGTKILSSDKYPKLHTSF